MRKGPIISGHVEGEVRGISLYGEKEKKSEKPCERRVLGRFSRAIGKHGGVKRKTTRHSLSRGTFSGMVNAFCED